ncbi:hypothetical protein IE077_001793 [Cardiosporidium cionae]|uniref:Gfo/Idh/MocA-like oxidoreductase N-terminal domain-containing protein n=1 Tax=Cardiosporidium cionae TaxID=476202 RepID=A0ABQ7JCB0_9APIC|nr:hypothetical protein IE077_001793 [Cardiosporidium cionae]|eukprot:KAF8821619.1 hypothetical protein IE077_001793 [Cardiosporidium cionae]
MKTHVIRVALLGEEITDRHGWIPLLNASSSIQLVAVWSQHQKEAETLYHLVGNADVQIYFDIPTQINESLPRSRCAAFSRPSLDTLISQDIASAYLLDLPSETHYDVTLKLLKARKHLFNARIPTFCADKFYNLLDTYQKAQETEHNQTNPVWWISEIVRYETAFAKIKNIIPDIGTILGAQLTASLTETLESMDLSTAPLLSTCHPSEPLMNACVSYSALLQDLLGDYESLNFKFSTSAVNPKVVDEAMVGTAVFCSGALCSVIINRSDQLGNFSLIVWGTNGNVSVKLLPGRPTFEVQRNLHHYEHPTYHPFTGAPWALKAWIDRILHNLKSDASILQALTDISVVNAMVESNGNTVKVRRIKTDSLHACCTSAKKKTESSKLSVDSVKS